MSVRPYKPTTPSRRGMTTTDTSAITTKKPVKSLVVTKKRINGRNNSGRITVRHRGGGVKRHYRLVNFNLPEGTKATVEHIEYDPNRSAHIARVRDQNDKLHYIIAAKAMKQGSIIEVGKEAPVKDNNRLALRDMPTGTLIYDIELTLGKGAQLVRSAGNTAQLMAKEGEYAQVKLPSGETRLVHLECKATIGGVGNEQHQNVKIGNAGRNRRKGKRPTVRGLAMNAVDHPLGGGDGGSHGAGRPPKTPWGQQALGRKTRSRKSTTKYIVRTRHEGKRK